MSGSRIEAARQAFGMTSAAIAAARWAGGGASTTGPWTFRAEQRDVLRRGGWTVRR